MTQESIFSPFFATMFLTFLVWVYMYIRRINLINTQKLDPQDLVAPDALSKLSPAKVSNPSNNFKNL